MSAQTIFLDAARTWIFAPGNIALMSGMRRLKFHFAIDVIAEAWRWAQAAVAIDTACWSMSSFLSGTWTFRMTAHDYKHMRGISIIHYRPINNDRDQVTHEITSHVAADWYQRRWPFTRYVAMASDGWPEAEFSKRYRPVIQLTTAHRVPCRHCFLNRKGAGIRISPRRRLPQNEYSFCALCGLLAPKLASISSTPDSISPPRSIYSKMPFSQPTPYSQCRLSHMSSWKLMRYRRNGHSLNINIDICRWCRSGFFHDIILAG